MNNHRLVGSSWRAFSMDGLRESTAPLQRWLSGAETEALIIRGQYVLARVLPLHAFEGDHSELEVISRDDFMAVNSAIWNQLTHGTSLRICLSERCKFVLCPVPVHAMQSERGHNTQTLEVKVAHLEAAMAELAKLMPIKELVVEATANAVKKFIGETMKRGLGERKPRAKCPLEVAPPLAE